VAPQRDPLVGAGGVAPRGKCPLPVALSRAAACAAALLFEDALGGREQMGLAARDARRATRDACGLVRPAVQKLLAGEEWKKAALGYRDEWPHNCGDEAWSSHRLPGSKCYDLIWRRASARRRAVRVACAFLSATRPPSPRRSVVWRGCDVRARRCSQSHSRAAANPRQTSGRSLRSPRRSKASVASRRRPAARASRRRAGSRARAGSRVLPVAQCNF